MSSTVQAKKTEEKKKNEEVEKDNNVYCGFYYEHYVEQKIIERISMYNVH